MAFKFRLQIAPEKRPETWDAEKSLADALAERDLFLENNPKYKAFQREISIMLDKAGSSENRMAVLAMLMEAKLLELQKELRQLNSILLSVAGQKGPQTKTNRISTS